MNKILVMLTSVVSFVCQLCYVNQVTFPMIAPSISRVDWMSRSMPILARECAWSLSFWKSCLPLALQWQNFACSINGKADFSKASNAFNSPITPTDDSAGFNAATKLAVNSVMKVSESSMSCSADKVSLLKSLDAFPISSQDFTDSGRSTDAVLDISYFFTHASAQFWKDVSMKNLQITVMKAEMFFFASVKTALPDPVAPLLGCFDEASM